VRLERLEDEIDLCQRHLENLQEVMINKTVSKKYSQELARRTIDAMHELSNGRLGKIKRQRSKDGLSYQETRLVLKADVELPGEVGSKDSDAAPATDGIAGE
jgi:predicted DNA binding CopG/RHH family protein